jgi:8-oxo-dGTP pyrophosphatase MutT (NUDIX family)
MQKKSKYPSPYYRASIKAIIRNKADEVLLVKEKSDSWNLPGGGMDHGEDALQTLTRELYEEVLITVPFRMQPLGIEPMMLQSQNAWLLWVVYELEFDGPFDFDVGADADEAAFINPKTLKNSSSRSERLVYRWCVDKNAKFE